MSRAQMTEPELAELADRAAPLDALLVDAALGPMRRLAPNSSTLRFAARLARHPGAIAADTVRVRRHQGGERFADAVAGPAVGDQGTDQQQDHARGGQQSGGPPQQSDEDTHGGGQFGDADEPVAVPGDAEVRG